MGDSLGETLFDAALLLYGQLAVFTKAEARSMGENLKNRRLINDYYVANYKRPEDRQPVPIRNPD